VQTSASHKVREGATCKSLRKKRRRQKRDLAAATTHAKRSHLQAKIKHVGKRMKRLGCKSRK